MIEQALLVVSVLSIIVCLSLISNIVILKKRNNDLNKELADLKESTNESYLKFLSDSRDWAFQYIEEVQKVLTKFANDVGPRIKYFNTYGRLVPTHNDEALDAISEAFDELTVLLPQEKQGEK